MPSSSRRLLNVLFTLYLTNVKNPEIWVRYFLYYAQSTDEIVMKNDQYLAKLRTRAMCGVVCFMTPNVVTSCTAGHSLVNVS